MSSASWPGFPALQAKLDRLANPDPKPVLTALEHVIRADNETGILAGLDRLGQPMPRTWRQDHAESRWVTRVLPDGRRVRFKMLGSDEGGDGPPLAPHRKASRVIDKLRTGFFRDGDRWVVFGAWEDVLSKRGVPFLPFHFRGEGALPARDLAGLRPAGYARAVEVVDAWASNLLGE